MTVRGFIEVYNKMREEFSDFELPCGLASQDSVEHLFSQVRQRGGFNLNPSARTFRINSRHMLGCGMIQASDRANVRCEPAPYLISPVTAVSKQLAIARNMPDTEDTEDVDSERTEGIDRYVTDNLEDMQEIEELIYILENCEEQMEIQLDSSDERLESGHSQQIKETAKEITTENPDEMERIEVILNEALGFYESNAINNFAEVIARHVLTKHKCQECRITLEREESEPLDESEHYLQLREFPNKDGSKDGVKKLTRSKITLTR